MIALLWQWVLSCLVWLSADTTAIEHEPARCAAAVLVARTAVLGAASGSDGVEGVATIKTPKFDAHCKTCKRCTNRNPNGPGLCEEGFRLWQEDLRDSKKKTCVSGSCPAK